VINNFGGFYRTEVYVHEARMCGANIEAPCINHSTHLTNIYGDDVYIGLIHIADLQRKLAQQIVNERLMHGDYRSMQDFVSRIDIRKDQLEILIRIGAFRFTGLNKYELMWEKNAVHNPIIRHHGETALFEIESEDFSLPSLKEGKYEQAFDEIELLGFPLCSPFDLLSSDFKGQVVSSDLIASIGRRVNMLGYYVAQKHVTTVNRKHMSFGTWLDTEGNFFDTTHFPPALAAYPFKGRGCYAIEGVIVDDFGFPSMEVTRMEKLPFVKDERY